MPLPSAVSSPRCEAPPPWAPAEPSARCARLAHRAPLLGSTGPDTALRQRRAHSGSRRQSVASNGDAQKFTSRPRGVWHQPARRSQLTKGGDRRHHDTQDQVGNSVIDPVGNYVIVDKRSLPSATRLESWRLPAASGVVGVGDLACALPKIHAGSGSPPERRVRGACTAAAPLAPSYAASS